MGYVLSDKLNARLRMIRLDDSAELPNDLLNIIPAESAVIVSGVGMLTDVELGWFDTDKKMYITHTFPGSYEILSFSGNLSKRSDSKFLHVHVALGTRDKHVIGGHLVRAKVLNTLELFILELDEILYRDENSKLNVR